ncbi:MAG: hypothetical protein OXU32_14325, partial [Gammaproteobacteria bacterium]|nr:hypothetical protein [Gammaproteobacteria bacterium]
ALLAEQLRNYWVQSDNGARIEEIVQKASTAIDQVAEVLSRLDRNRGRKPESPGTKALIWLNALVFQELLASHLDMSLLPAEHRQKTISRPDPAGTTADLERQWEEILAINWWPIFHVARETLRATPGSPGTHLAIGVLIRTAREIVESGMIRRHDVAGRVFHRLLDSRKFLATNYTTIPAAIMLAGLAFDERGPRWSEIDFASAESVAGLRIVDPACGSGTLLMAAAQEVLKRARRAGAPAQQAPTIVRTILEEALYGFDVVPAAIHLAASTLCMAEARQVVKDMNLWRVRHDVTDGVARLGSLDFLSSSPSQGNAARLSLFDDEKPSIRRVTGTGEVEDSRVGMPSKCHLVIANPPYTRAGGPGDEKNTVWNPIFGSLLDKRDAEKMKKALRKALDGTAASLYAGLGSAFVVLADEALDIGGRLAFVLPATMLTGSRWAPIRRLLLSKYSVEWVVVSHDLRNRSAKKGLPGRRLVSFSESTRIAEVLIVATRRRSGRPKDSRVCFVNLLRNPDEPIEALGLTRKLLALRDGLAPLEPAAIGIGETTWGNAVSVPQSDLPWDGGPWSLATFVQPGLALIANRIALGEQGGLGSVPVAELGAFADLGPYHMQVKNPKYGLFTVRERPTSTATAEWRLRAGIPALWHHKAGRNTCLAASADALLERRADSSRADQDQMLAKSGCLHLAADLGMAPQRVAAVMTDSPMLGFSSWISVVIRNSRAGKNEALCLWLNSTFGLLLRAMHGNRPYLGRSRVPHELARTMPVLDVDRLSNRQLTAAAAVYADLKRRELQGFSALADDPVRREMNERLCREVLEIDPEIVADITRKLSLEPTLHARH